MRDDNTPFEHLTDYERAVCYYALPRTSHPLTTGLIAAYAVCLLEAIALTGYGLYTGRDNLTTWGLIAMLALVVFGLLAFFLRALLGEVRRRRLLAATRNVPDAPEAAEDPDPFAGHILLRRPRYVGGQLFALTSDDSTIQYFIDSGPNGRWWNVRNEHDEEVCRVRGEGGALSFALGGSAPSRLSVHRGEALLGTVQRRFSLGATVVDLRGTDDTATPRSVRQGTVYRDKEEVGRLYALRGALYLDVRRDALDELLLAHFIAPL